MRASAPTIARAARSEAERAEKGAGQMRSCTPILVGTRAAGICHQACTAPRRARRTVPANPQAPSHADPRTARRHEGAGARLKRFFLFHRARRILFLSRTKREWGAHPRGTRPLREQASPWPPDGGPHHSGRWITAPTPPRWGQKKTDRPPAVHLFPLMPVDGLSDTRPSAGASPHGCRSGWTRCPRVPASPGWTAGLLRSPAGGRQRSGAGCGA